MAIDTSEAPKGFYAKLKSDINIELVGNFCNACDWRSTCQDKNTNFSDYGHKCMPYVTVNSRDEEIKRNDGASVVFKIIK